MSDDDYEDDTIVSVQHTELDGAVGRVIVIACVHCLKLVDDALALLQKEKIH